MVEEKIIYTVEEVQHILGIGRVQAYDLVKTKQFPVKHIGKRIVIPVKPFMDWLNSKDED